MSNQGIPMATPRPTPVSPHPDRADLSDGQVYWTFLPSVEASGYGDSFDTPWRGRIRINHVRPGTDVPYIHRFDPQTGQIDRDANAAAIVPGPDSLFFRRQDAVRAFMREIRRWAVAQVEFAFASVEEAVLGIEGQEQEENHDQIC